MLESGNKAFELIDKLQVESECYYVDFLPKKMKSRDYFRLEEYLLETYIDIYAKKIADIALKLLCYYSGMFFLTDTNDDLPPEGEDLSDKPFAEIVDIITSVIKNDYSSVQLLFTEKSFVMSINGGFSVNFYNPCKDDLDLIVLLVQQKGLFLRKAVD